MQRKNIIYLFLLTLEAFQLSSCKKDSLPSITKNLLKSYPFDAVDGAAIQDNGFVLIGKTNVGNINRNTELMKIDAQGDIQWQHSFPFVFVDSLGYYNFRETSSHIGGVVYSGGNIFVPVININYKSINALGHPFYPYDLDLYNYNLGGQNLFIKHIDSIPPNFPNSYANYVSPSLLNGESSVNYLQYIFIPQICCTSLANGNILIAVSWLNPLYTGTSDQMINTLYFIDNNGNLIRKTDILLNYSIAKITEANNGDIICMGINTIARYNITAGTIVWQQEFNSTPLPLHMFSYYYSNTLITPDNNILICGGGDIGGGAKNKLQAGAFKININTSDTIYCKLFGTPQDFCLSSIISNDNEFVFIGVSNSLPYPAPDNSSSIYFAKIDQNGNVLNQQTLAQNQSCAGLLISQNSDNSYSIVGIQNAYGSSASTNTIFLRTTIP